MKASLFFIFYFLTAAFMAALIAYPLFQLFGSDEFRFERWVTRAALLLLVLGMFPCFRYFNLNFRAIGHNNSVLLFCKQASTGFFAGLLILASVIFLLIFLDIRQVSHDAAITFKLILKALLAGLIVALIEETLFRGFFFKLANIWHQAITAVLLSSFFYALLHFIKPIEHIDQTQLSINTGFEVIINAFEGLLYMPTDDFFALFVVGIFLALVRLRTQTLSYCIGLHASWVFLIKITKDLTETNALSQWAYLTGEYDGIIGYLSIFWLSLLSCAYLIYIMKSPHQAST